MGLIRPDVEKLCADRLKLAQLQATLAQLDTFGEEDAKFNPAKESVTYPILLEGASQVYPMPVIERAIARAIAKDLYNSVFLDEELQRRNAAARVSLEVGLLKCPACAEQRCHSKEERTHFHPYAGHGYSTAQGWTHPDLQHDADLKARPKEKNVR